MELNQVLYTSWYYNRVFILHNRIKYNLVDITLSSQQIIIRGNKRGRLQELLVRYLDIIIDTIPYNISTATAAALPPRFILQKGTVYPIGSFMPRLSLCTQYLSISWKIRLSQKRGRDDSMSNAANMDVSSLYRW